MEKTQLTPMPSLHQVTLTKLGDAAPSDQITLHPGQRLGPFELRHLLGAGGMGQVFLAEQLYPVQRQVALKFSQQRLGTSEASVRFDIERQALARMSHPAIAQVFEAGTTADGFPYLAMEYVPGEVIDACCRRCKLTLHSRLELFIRVALGVQHAHQKRILHLDLKPANVLVTRVDGVAQPKIIDFGLALSTVRLPGQRSGMSMAGTPGYMSPEQAGVLQNGVVLDVDTRSDTYALGVILHQLLTDQPPFDADQFSGLSSDQLRSAVASFDPPRPSQQLQELKQFRMAARVRGDLDAVVGCATHPVRNQRYESASDLIDEIRNFLSFRPVRAHATTRSHRLRLYVRRNRVALAMTAALGLSLLAGLGAATYGLLQARAERDLVAARQRDLERVTEFQQSMLAGLDPAGQIARSVIMSRDLLRRHEAYFGADVLETIHARQVYAALMGRACDLEAATPLLRLSLEQLQTRFGDSDPRTLTAWYLARNYLALGRDAEAATIIESEVDFLRDTPSEQLNPPEQLAQTQLREHEL